MENYYNEYYNQQYDQSESWARSNWNDYDGQVDTEWEMKAAKDNVLEDHYQLADAAIDSSWHLAHAANKAFDIMQHEIGQRNDLDENQDVNPSEVSYENRVNQVETRIAFAKENFAVLSAMAAPAMTMVGSPFSAAALEARKIADQEHYMIALKPVEIAENVLNAYKNMQSRIDELSEKDLEVYDQLEGAINETLETMSGEWAKKYADLIRMQLSSGKRLTYKAIGAELGVPPNHVRDMIASAYKYISRPDRLAILTEGMDEVDFTDYLPTSPTITLERPSPYRSSMRIHRALSDYPERQLINSF